MAKEVLAIPEEHLSEVIAIIRIGMKHSGHPPDSEVVQQLTQWCDEEEEYLKVCADEN